MALSGIAAFLLLSFIASFIQRVSGFGFAILVMTVFPYLMPSYGEATALSGLLSLCLAVTIIIRYHKFICIKKQIPLLATFLVVNYFVIEFVSSASDSSLRKILGIALILLSIYFCIFSERIKLKSSYPVQISLGALSAITGGLFAMQGPPIVLYFIASEKTKEHYIAGIQFYFFMTNIIMTLFRIKAGFLTQAVGIAWCAGIMGLIAGAFLGSKLFNVIPINILRKIVYIYMALSGVIALL